MAWRQLLEFNYWPIFHLAEQLLHRINPPEMAYECIQIIAQTTKELEELGVADSHDLAGVVFQRFISDREYLASFFTRPVSATLLSYLAIPKTKSSSVENFKDYRIADYACGTGTLIHAAYKRVSQLIELDGGDASAHHKSMMENSLTAIDIVPSAAHLTAAMLSSVHPKETYEESRILIAEYGEMDHRGVAIGSLELLDKGRNWFPFSTRCTGADWWEK